VSADNPRVRASLVCPLCNGAKDAGLVACWPCFRSSGLKQGDPAAEARVAARERSLAPDDGFATAAHNVLSRAFPTEYAAIGREGVNALLGVKPPRKR
jgi:hypothetical protein